MSEFLLRQAAHAIMRTILLRVADKQVFSNVKCNRHMQQLFIAVAGVVFVGADHFPDIEFVPEDATVVPGFPIAFNATPCCPLLKSDGTPATLTLRLTSASPRLTLEPSVFTWDGNDTNAWKQTQTFTATGTAGASYDLDIFSAVSTTIESDSDLYNQDTTVHLRVGLAAQFSPPPKPPPPSPPPVKPPPPGPPPGHPCPPVPPSPPQRHRPSRQRTRRNRRSSHRRPRRRRPRHHRRNRPRRGHHPIPNTSSTAFYFGLCCPLPSV